MDDITIQKLHDEALSSYSKLSYLMKLMHVSGYPNPYELDNAMEWLSSFTYRLNAECAKSDRTD